MITPATLQPIADAAKAGLQQISKFCIAPGVNLSGAEFGFPAIPGVFGVNYTFPPLADLTYYVSKGMRLIRLPFVWERIQPVLGGPLDPAHIAWLNSFITYDPNVIIVLDCHNMGGAFGGMIGIDGPTNQQFADFWALLATTFNAPNVIYGLMNEPHLSSAQWTATATAAIAGIRATGSTNTISIANIGFEVAFNDPNYLIEAHIYFDADNSGTHSTAASPTVGPDRVAHLTAWGRTNGIRLFLGEFGAANNAGMFTAMGNMISFMQVNPDVWMGWTYWSGGPWWGSYFQSIEPTNLGQSNQADAAQMTALLTYLP